MMEPIPWYHRLPTKRRVQAKRAYVKAAKKFEAGDVAKLFVPTIETNELWRRAYVLEHCPEDTPFATACMIILGEHY